MHRRQMRSQHLKLVLMRRRKTMRSRAAGAGSWSLLPLTVVHQLQSASDSIRIPPARARKQRSHSRRVNLRNSQTAVAKSPQQQHQVRISGRLDRHCRNLPSAAQSMSQRSRRRESSRKALHRRHRAARPSLQEQPVSRPVRGCRAVERQLQIRIWSLRRSSRGRMWRTATRSQQKLLKVSRPQQQLALTWQLLRSQQPRKGQVNRRRTNPQRRIFHQE
mmetsp:Transcript_44499/g.82797  ORF Transcript_44499/g.82797 Transcript_44499/m.82797 type:complete len:219 (+) Transcript_44499:833-1489(+)